MKNLISFFVFAICILSYAKSQEFSFKMFFEDAVGNKDSIVIGYDPNATNGIDEDFGEVNILETPFKPDFEVRISNEWKQRHDLGKEEVKWTLATYHTKKQKLKKSQYSLNTMDMVVGIDICTENYPVKAYWDNTLFTTDTFLIKSLFTSFYPWAWWDVGSTFIYNLAEKDEGMVTPMPHFEGEPCYPWYGYVNKNDSLVDMYWVRIGKEDLYEGINEAVQNDIVIYPNPAKNEINIVQKNEDFNISIFDISGKIISNTYESTGETGIVSIDISDLVSSIYIIEAKGKNIYRAKFVKK